MCLAVPAKIMELDGTRAMVDIDGLKRSANVAFIEEPQIGDFVLLHAGFAIRKWSRENVDEYRQMIHEYTKQD